MSLLNYFPAPLCLRLMSYALLSAPLCRVSCKLVCTFTRGGVLEDVLDKGGQYRVKKYRCTILVPLPTVLFQKWYGSTHTEVLQQKYSVFSVFCYPLTIKNQTLSLSLLRLKLINFQLQNIALRFTPKKGSRCACQQLICNNCNISAFAVSFHLWWQSKSKMMKHLCV